MATLDLPDDKTSCADFMDAITTLKNQVKQLSEPIGEDEFDQWSEPYAELDVDLHLLDDGGTFFLSHALPIHSANALLNARKQKVING